MPIFKSTVGSVTYKVKQLPGCCGVAVVYHCDFCVTGYRWARPPKTKLKTLYKEFDNFLSSAEIERTIPESTVYSRNSTTRWQVNTPCGYQRYPYDLYRSHIVMTDYAQRGWEYSSTYDFCTTMKWKNTAKFPNKKTGNTVYVFGKSIKRFMEI